MLVTIRRGAAFLAMKRGTNKGLSGHTLDPMKAILLSILSVLLVAGSGCTDRSAEAEKAKREAEAKARAEAAKKDMDTLPKTFSNDDYFKKNEPAKTTTPT